MTAISDIALAIRKRRFPLHDEKQLQKEIGEALASIIQGGTLSREFVLDRNNIIDFFVDPGIGIEVKIKGSKRDIFRQCTRYCQFDIVKSLILITNLSMGFPEQINGKDCYVIKLGTAWL
ncbi:MAG TPA: hypothetical protein VGN00_14210 [Puia sp.]|jgi:hypothetical protein